MKKQNGNVLFLILIAVALFAALSYAVTTSSRSGESTISKDKAKLAASQINQYVSQLRQAINRLKVINGCSDTQISFSNPVRNDFDYTTPAPDRCKVFHPDGGGLSYLQPDSSWLASGYSHSFYGYYQFTGKSHIQDVGTDNGLSNGDSAELLLVFPYINSEVCAAFNDLNKIDHGTTLTLHWSLAFKNGNYGQSALVSDTTHKGRYEGCTGLLLYAVLLAR